MRRDADERSLAYSLKRSPDRRSIALIGSAAIRLIRRILLTHFRVEFSGEEDEHRELCRIIQKSFADLGTSNSQQNSSIY